MRTGPCRGRAVSPAEGGSDRGRCHQAATATAFLAAQSRPFGSGMLLSAGGRGVDGCGPTARPFSSSPARGGWRGCVFGVASVTSTGKGGSHGTTNLSATVRSTRSCVALWVAMWKDGAKCPLTPRTTQLLTQFLQGHLAHGFQPCLQIANSSLTVESSLRQPKCKCK